MLACKVLPDKGQDTFIKLKKEVGYTEAVTIFDKITGSDFANLYGDSVTFDSDGIPTFESIMKLPIIREYIGEQTIMNNLNKKQPHMEDTLENVALLINKAKEFNDSGENKEFIAIVDYDDDNKITLNIRQRNQESIEIATNQYKIQKLNEAAASMLGKAGITLDMLSSIERAAGRVGVTEFRHLSGILEEFDAIIRVANNLEGFNAISEELAHLIIGANKDNVLVKRSIDFFKNERNAREILGNEFDKVYEYYNGNMELVAEEAAGHVFRDSLLDRIDNRDTAKLPLFRRMFNSIISLFKGINPATYKDTLDSIRYGYNKLAEDFLSGKKEITKKSIADARREASFNALSEKVDAQIQVLRDITTQEYKHSTLQLKLKNSKLGDTRKSIMTRADRMSSIIDKAEISGESMKAITQTVSLIKQNIDLVFKQISSLDTYSTQDKFKVLENALSTITAYSKMLDRIDVIVSEEYTSDESVASQSFMIEDLSDSLTPYRNTGGIDTIDTSNMTMEQIIQVMQSESQKWKLSNDKTHYVNGNKKGLRVTSTIEAVEGVEPINPSNPYVKPSTNIGTGIDELTRDFFDGRIVKSGSEWLINGKYLDEVYPNADRDSLNEFCNQLQGLKQYFESKGITIIARDIKAEGTIDTVDGMGVVHTVNVVGTLDLIGYDKKGNFIIYDMKTHRGEITKEHKEKWSRQLTLYKKFLEQKYGIKVSETRVIPISVSYPKPSEVSGGTANYTVSTEEKPEDYRGEENNQLLIDGEEFRGAKPSLQKKVRTILIKESEFDIEYSKLADDPTNGMGKGYDTLISVIRNSRELLKDIERLFKLKSLPEFAKFLSSFIGETVEIADPDNPGKFKTIDIKELLTDVDVDINWAQKMLATMADTPNTLLQAFDKIIKDKKHLKRLKTIDMAQKITALGIKYEKLGITDYSFMFENDKIEYINKDYNRSSYNKAFKEFSKKLDEKYGNTKIGSTEYKAKKKELIKWIEDHTISKKIDGRKQTIPNPELFPSSFNTLTDTQKELYDEWMSIKDDLDNIIGKDKTHLTNSIKIRRSGIERLRGAISGNAISAMVEKAKSSVFRSYDDETSYATSVRDINGEEKMSVPLLYLNLNGASSDDISTDIIGTLIAYADMAYNYEAMNEIVDALEIGKVVVRNNLEIHKRRKSDRVKEIFTPRGKRIESDVVINTEKSNIMQAINNLLESKVYERHQKEVSDFLGMDANKLTSVVTRLGSAVQLGFNFFAHVANLISGVAMANIEAAAHEYFTPSDLAKADFLYFSNIGEALGDISSRTKFSKLFLLSEKFDIQLKFSKQIRHTDFTNRNFITRFFGPSVQFIGQEGGDHWLYHRVALAFLNKNVKLKLNGESISLWDAYETVPIDKDNPEAGNKLILKEGVTKEDGSQFTDDDITEISGKIWEMNKKLFGVYNVEDRVEARRYILGKFGMQYRDWMPSLYRHKFGKASSSLEGGRRTEGFYRTTGRFAMHLFQDLRNGQMNITQAWEDLDDNERTNIRRAIADSGQLLLIVAIAALLKGDPKDRPWATRAISYMATRMTTEVGALHPLGVWSEGRKILKSPFAATSIVDNLDGMKSLLWPPNYFDEIERGDYKGHSSAYKAFMKSPFSLWYSTIKRQLTPERAENYYDQ